jgi:hypothetical protein
MLQTTWNSTLRLLALTGLLSIAATQAAGQVVISGGCPPKSSLCRMASQAGSVQNQVAAATNTVNSTTAVTVQAVGAAQRAKDVAGALLGGKMTTAMPQTVAPGTRQP